MRRAEGSHYLWFIVPVGLCCIPDVPPVGFLLYVIKT